MTDKGKDGARSGARERQGRDAYAHRLKRMREQGLKPPVPPHGEEAERMASEFALDCGWGRLVFAQTFDNTEAMISALSAEQPDRRDIAVYVRDPHVLLANAPQELFLDPSHTYRLDLSRYRASPKSPKGFFHPAADIAVGCRCDQPHLCRPVDDSGAARVLLVEAATPAPSSISSPEDEQTGELLGTVTGVDHMRAFNDPEQGSSLWCLAVDPAARHPGHRRSVGAAAGGVFHHAAARPFSISRSCMTMSRRSRFMKSSASDGCRSSRSSARTPSMKFSTPDPRPTRPSTPMPRSSSRKPGAGASMSRRLTRQPVFPPHRRADFLAARALPNSLRRAMSILGMKPNDPGWFPLPGVDFRPTAAECPSPDECANSSRRCGRRGHPARGAGPVGHSPARARERRSGIGRGRAYRKRVAA